MIDAIMRSTPSVHDSTTMVCHEHTKSEIELAGSGAGQTPGLHRQPPQAAGGQLIASDLQEDMRGLYIHVA